MKRYKPEEIVALLRQTEVGIANGKSTPQACKETEINPQTYCPWRKEYGGLKTEQAQRMKELENENGRLRRMGSQDVIETLSEAMLWRGIPDP